MPCILTFTAHGGTDEYLDFTMQFGPAWDGVENDGDPIPKARTSVVDFYIKYKADDTSYLMHLSDADSAEIEWLDEVNGQIAVRVGKNMTNAMAGDYLYWELKLTTNDSIRVVLGSGRCKLVKTLE